MMKYKGYLGKAEYDSEAKIFHGDVIGLKDVITFQGKNVDELEQAFKDSVDDYIAWCDERGQCPEKTYSGNVRLRMDPILHADLVYEAARNKMSLNEFINQKLRK